jgi:hypothetical protein
MCCGTFRSDAHSAVQFGSHFKLILRAKSQPGNRGVTLDPDEISMPAKFGCTSRRRADDHAHTYAPSAHRARHARRVSTRISKPLRIVAVTTVVAPRRVAPTRAAITLPRVLGAAFAVTASR